MYATSAAGHKQVWKSFKLPKLRVELNNANTALTKASYGWQQLQSEVKSMDNKIASLTIELQKLAAEQKSKAYLLQQLQQQYLSAEKRYQLANLAVEKQQQLEEDRKDAFGGDDRQYQAAYAAAMAEKAEAEDANLAFLQGGGRHRQPIAVRPPSWQHRYY